MVTGQLDVRGLALPEVEDEAVSLDDEAEEGDEVAGRGRGRGGGMSTDTSEKGLELLILRALTGLTDEQILAKAGDRAGAKGPGGYGGTGYVLGRSEDYDRDHAVDLRQAARVHPEHPARSASSNWAWATEGPARLQVPQPAAGRGRQTRHRGRAAQRRRAGPVPRWSCSTARPRPAMPRRKELWDANIFSVTRQLRYSKDETKLALDLALFINGLPVATFELKNRLTKQTVDDAVQQYKRDRDPRELLFGFARCLVHFAVDDQQVMFCTKLAGKDSWFLPFNKGWNDGAGNPPNPDGMKTDYLWKEILTREGLTDILENYAQRVETKDEKTGRKKEVADLPPLPPARRRAEAHRRRRARTARAGAT